MSKPSIIYKKCLPNYYFIGFLPNKFPLFIDPGTDKEWWNSIMIFPSIKSAKIFSSSRLEGCLVRKVEDLKGEIKWELHQ